MRSGEFLIGLLDPAGPGFVAAEDFDGPHGDALRTWQRLGLVGGEPGVHPAPSCPHCGQGVPYRAEGRPLCGSCRSALDPRDLLAWAVDREAFLAAVAAHLCLRGGARPVDGSLWELGTYTVGGTPLTCYYHPGGPLPETARRRVAAFRRVLVLYGPSAPEPAVPGRWVPLGELLNADGTLVAVALADLLRVRGRVRFDADAGTLRVASTLVGEVPVGSREWALLACLAEQLDQFVPYRDLKRAVLSRTGGSGGTDEATFCQKLKNRIKKRYVTGIDRLVVTNNKGEGYRLRVET